MKLLKAKWGDGKLSRYLSLLLIAFFMLAAGSMAGSFPLPTKFNGPVLYTEVFEKLRDDHIGLLEMSPADRQTWVAEWQNKFKGTTQLDTESGTDEAVQQMLSSLKFVNDSYWLPAQWTKRSEDRRAEFGGIGITLYVRGADEAAKALPSHATKEQILAARKVTKNRPMIVHSDPRQDSPAQKAGLRKGDVILYVDDKSLAGKTTDDAVQAIRGKVDTSVKLTLRRKGVRGKSYTFVRKIKRATIPIDMVEHKELGDGVYHVKINTFAFDRFEQDVSTALKEAAGYNAVLLNVRGNSGGDRDNALQLLEWLVPEGIIYVEISRIGNALRTETISLTATEKVRTLTWSDNRPSQTFRTQRKPLLVPAGTPLLVLMNGGSASASEITAGGLKGTGRASMLVGARSFGKGHGQNVWNLRFGRGLIAVNFRFKPGNIDMDGIGIDPDVEDKNDDMDKAIEFGKQEALKYLKAHP